MRCFLFTLCIVSLLFNGVAVANGSVATRASGKVAALVSKVTQAGAALALGAMLVCGVTGCEQGRKMVSSVIGGGDDETQTMQPINIGVVYEQDLFPQSLRGIELAATQINHMGGINGRPIVLLPRDNERSGGVTYDVTEELILAQRVHALVGPNFSTLAKVGDELAQRYGVPMVTIGSTNPGVTAAGDMVFLAAFTDSFQGRVMAKLAVEELGADTAAVLYYDADVYSEGLAETFTNSFEMMGGDVVVSVAYPPYNDVAEFDSFVMQLGAKLSPVVDAQPDVVFIPGFVPDAPTVATLLREAGVMGVFLGGDGWGSGDLIGIGGDAIDGAFFSDHFTAAGEGLGESTTKFIADYTAASGETPDALAALGFDALWIVGGAAIRGVKGELSLEEARQAIRNEIAATKDYKGATNIAAYNEDRHPVKSAVVKTIKDKMIIYHTTINP